MGTRHLTGVILNNEFKVAQYGQWDGYPEGQGATVIKFLSRLLKEDGLEHFKNQLMKTRFYKSEDNSEDILANEDFKNGRREYLHRDTGAEILNLIYESDLEEIRLVDSSDFARNSLFCEYAYIINLDDMTLEFYKGFNKTPLEEGQRFKNLKSNPAGPSRGQIKNVTKLGWNPQDEFYPIKMVLKDHISVITIPLLKKFEE